MVCGWFADVFGVVMVVDGLHAVAARGHLARPTQHQLGCADLPSEVEFFYAKR